MGGRGASSGLKTVHIRRRRTPLHQLIQARNAATSTAGGSDPGDYTDNNNPALLKYQQQADDKLARFLAKVGKTTDYVDYDDGYGYYDNSFQKLVLQLGLNAAPTVLSDTDFDAYVQQTGADVFYRGWSTRRSAARFVNATYTHTGTGIYGDGIYFSPDRNTARSYGSGAVTKMALSPTARVIDHATLRRKMQSASPNLRSALSAAGSKGSRSYSPNNGEAQYALKLGYNVVRVGSGPSAYWYALTRDAFIVSKKF